MKSVDIQWAGIRLWEKVTYKRIRLHCLELNTLTLQWSETELRRQIKKTHHIKPSALHITTDTKGILNFVIRSFDIFIIKLRNSAISLWSNNLPLKSQRCMTTLHVSILYLCVGEGWGEGEIICVGVSSSRKGISINIFLEILKTFLLWTQTEKQHSS